MVDYTQKFGGEILLLLLLMLEKTPQISYLPFLGQKKNETNKQKQLKKTHQPSFWSNVGGF